MYNIYESGILCCVCLYAHTDFFYINWHDIFLLFFLKTNQGVEGQVVFKVSGYMVYHRAIRGLYFTLAYFTKEVNPVLAEPPSKFNDGLAKPGLTS